VSYEPNFEVTRDEDDMPAPWHVRKLDGTGELHLSDWDALTLAARIREGQPRVDDEWFIPPRRWDDYPHLLDVSKAAWRVEQPQHAVDHDRYAAELVAALADQGLAVVPIPRTQEARAAARRGEAVTGEDVRHLLTVASALTYAGGQLRQYAKKLDTAAVSPTP
jgi:hypothetical protein